MSDPKSQLRSEERSKLPASKARLLMDDGTTEIEFVGIDLSTQGIGLLIKGSAVPGTTLRLVADRVGEIKLQIVWSRPDLVRPSYSHIGMKAADADADLRGFFTKVFVAEEADPVPVGPENAKQKVSEDVVLLALKALNTDDPNLFKKANLAHLQTGHRIFPFIHSGKQYAVVVPAGVNTNILRAATVEQARQHVRLFDLVEINKGMGTSFRSRLVWPDLNVAGTGPILLVEDDAELLELMKGFLTKNGFATLECQNGKTALATIKRHPEIAAVVTDIKMPEMDGITMITHANEELKSRGGPPPFIVVSGYVTPEVLKQGKRLGVVHWFVKPIETSDLLDGIASVVITNVA